MRQKWIALLLVLISTLAFSNAAFAKAKIRVLLLSGDDVSAHNWQQIADATKQVLLASDKFEVTTAEQLTALESDTLTKDFDLIFITRYNRQGTLSDKGKANLLQFVKSGKGLALSHLASASFPEWTEFQTMVGRHWVMGASGHGPRSIIKATITPAKSPITKGIADFETDDELYAKLQGDAQITVLVTADSDWSKKTEPLVFTVKYGKGRIFHETLGHDAKAINNPTTAQLIVNGSEWAATGKVTKEKK